MAKRRVYEVAREFRISSEALIGMLRKLGFEVKSHMSTVDDETVAAVKKEFEREKEAVKQKYAKTVKKAAKPAKKVKKAPGREVRVKKERGRRRRVEEDTEAGKEKGDIEDAVRKTLSMPEEGRKRQRRRKRDRADIDAEGANDVPKVTEFASVGELAAVLDIQPNDIIRYCMDMGMMVTINQRLDRDIISMIAEEFSKPVEFLAEYGSDLLKEEESAVEETNIRSRPPVVTVMGHVDHGKTKLLDYIRKTNVVAGEAGGITQHIGAYEAEYEGRRIAFIDTPGHEAFTAMRARGAEVTDIVVLVVAADDGVMPQTLEAIDHARAAGVPIIVAINKIDLPAANPERVKQELSKHALTVEEWGGDTVAIECSAKTGEGVNKLLEMLILQAELLDLTAAFSGPARGVVLEAKKDRGRGIVTNALIQRGMLRVGDPYVAGIWDGKVRALFDQKNANVDEAGPSTPVQILGTSGVPQAGHTFAVASSDHVAKEISAKRRQLEWEHSARYQRRVSLLDLHDQIMQGEIKELYLVIKGDVDGSVGALSDSLEKLSTSEVQVKVIHRAVGAVSESDVLLAAASNAIIIGFHTQLQPGVTELAEREHVDLRSYRVIYEAVADVKAAMEGLLEPVKKEVVTGMAEVREIFPQSKRSAIAGVYVLSGNIVRGAKMRILRDQEVMHEGTVSSLRRFKDDVREVQTGFECGIGIDDFSEMKVGDVIQTYSVEEVARRL
jgi:translation initiation factor IF-2